MHKYLLNIIAQNASLTEADIDLCKTYFEPVLFPKNRIIEEAGAVPRHLYFAFR
jgi:hypothetical protein